MLARIGILKGLRSNNGSIVRSSVSPEVNGTDSFRGKAAGESNPLRLTDLNPTTRQAPQYAKRATPRSSAGQRCELRRERVAMLRKIALLTISAFGLTNIASGGRLLSAVLVLPLTRTGRRGPSLCPAPTRARIPDDYRRARTQDSDLHTSRAVATSTSPLEGIDGQRADAPGLLL